MSVDKFGRYSGDLTASLKLQRGPPGEGFKLTDDGHFNINNKRLCNVGDPESDNEAVNVRYMKQNVIILSNTDDCIDVKMKRINNLADPKEPLDAVNKIYLENMSKEKIPIKVKNATAYSFKKNRVTNVISPVNKLDAVNLEYMKINTIPLNSENNSFDVGNRIIERLHTPVRNEDAANKAYVDNKLPNSTTFPDCCDFSGNRLINVADPINMMDGINKQTLMDTINHIKSNCKKYTDDRVYYVRNENENSLDFKKNRLTNVGDPSELTDVINKQTLMNVMNIFRYDLERYTDKSVYFKHDLNNNTLDFKRARLVGINKPVNDDDAVTKSYLQSQLLNYHYNLFKTLYKIYKEISNDNPIKDEQEFYRIYMLTSLFELS